MISGLVEAGCDEAGRGPLAGSVFCAAVILDPARVEQVPEFEWLNDSKQLTEKQREALRPVIEREAVSWAVVEVTAKEIDERNILQCSIIGMQRALDKLTVRPQHILVDGNKWKPYVPEGELLEIPAYTVVHGDATYMSIAAASVLAKTYRDDYMNDLDAQYPGYDWCRNKGYPTKAHREAIKRLGTTPIHRMSYNLLGDGQLSLDF